MKSLAKYSTMPVIGKTTFKNTRAFEKQTPGLMPE